MRDGELKAMMAPLDHSKTGDRISFHSVCNLKEDQCSLIKYYWTFGDGGWSDESQPEHVYSRPGIYPVTLTISNGVEIVSFIQHITVEGTNITQTALSVSSHKEPSFRLRATDALDVYGWPSKRP